jgi:FAD:protein FMN transferase
MVEQRGFRSAGCRIVAARHYQRQFWQLARSGEMGRAASAGRCVAWMLAMLALAGTGRGDESLKRFSRTEIHMGVDFEVVLYAPDGATADRGLDAAMARIAELDSVLSDYKPESELSRLSAVSHVGAGKTAPAEFPATLVSPELWEVLAVSQEIAAASDGAFDITVGPLTKLWRRARRQKALPEPELFAAARAAVGWRYLKLDVRARTAQLMKANMRLDLGGIAKGYAADEALQKVSEAGLKRALVRASGDIAALEPPPSETGWLVGIAMFARRTKRCGSSVWRTWRFPPPEIRASMS